MFTAAIARHLHTLGLGTFDVAGATIHLEELPAAPADATSVAFKPAPPSGIDGYHAHGVQIVVRRSPTVGRARSGSEAAWAIRDALNGLRHITLAPGTIDEQRLVWMLADDSGPTNLGDDSNGVPRWSLRFIGYVPHDTAYTIL